MRQQYAIRSLFLVIGLALASLAVLAQMIRIQNSEQAKQFLIQGEVGEFITYYPERGEIYDRNGHLLAGNRTVYEVGVSLDLMEDVDALAYVLGTYLNMTFDEVKLNSPSIPNHGSMSLSKTTWMPTPLPL